MSGAELRAIAEKKNKCFEFGLTISMMQLLEKSNTISVGPQRGEGENAKLT